MCNSPVSHPDFMKILDYLANKQTDGSKKSTLLKVAEVKVSQVSVTDFALEVNKVK